MSVFVGWGGMISRHIGRRDGSAGGALNGIDCSDDGCSGIKVGCVNVMPLVA